MNQADWYVVTLKLPWVSGPVSRVGDEVCMVSPELNKRWFPGRPVGTVVSIEKIAS